MRSQMFELEPESFTSGLTWPSAKYRLSYIQWFMYRLACRGSPSFKLQRLGKAFKAMRENRSLTQVKVAELANVPRLAVIKIEAAETLWPSVPTTR